MSIDAMSHMDERILVCVYYGPNGERLIRRGNELARMTGCPLYILTIDRLPFEEFNAEKSNYVEEWKQLGDELGADKFILRDNEARPIGKVIKEVAYKHNITQVIIGETPQNRWEEITKGSFINILLKELIFIDIHIVAVNRALESGENAIYEKGIRGYLQRVETDYVLNFTKSNKNYFEGVFYKEIGTDFNNGYFKYVCGGKSREVEITDGQVMDEIKGAPNLKK